MFGFLKGKPKYDDFKVIIPGRNVITKVVYVQVIDARAFGHTYNFSYDNFSIDVDAFLDGRDLTFGVMRDRGPDTPWEILVDDQVIATGEWRNA